MIKLTKITRVRLGQAKVLTKANLGPFIENGNQVSEVPSA